MKKEKNKFRLSMKTGIFILILFFALLVSLATSLTWPNLLRSNNSVDTVILSPEPEIEEASETINMSKLDALIEAYEFADVKGDTNMHDDTYLVIETENACWGIVRKTRNPSYKEDSLAAGTAIQDFAVQNGANETEAGWYSYSTRHFEFCASNEELCKVGGEYLSYIEQTHYDLSLSAILEILSRVI